MIQLTSTQLKALTLLSDNAPRKLSETAVGCKCNKGNLSRALRGLQREGFIEIQGIGRSKRFMLSNSSHALAFAALAGKYHWEFDRLLYGKALFLLEAALDGPISIAELLERTGFSRATLFRWIRKLSSPSVLGSGTKGKYEIPIPEVKRFVQALQRFEDSRLCRKFFEKGTRTEMKRVRGRLFVLTTSKTEDKDFSLTGESLLWKFGIPLIIGDIRLLVFNPKRKKISLPQAICDMLAFETSPRTILYALLSIRKNNLKFSNMESTAEKLALEELCLKLFEYLKKTGEGFAYPFPAWKEFEAKWREYK